MPDRPRVNFRGARLLLVCVLALLLLAREHHKIAPRVATPVFSVALPYNTSFYFGDRLVQGAGTPLALGPPTTGWADFFPWAGSGEAPTPSCLAAPPPARPESAAPRDIAADLPGLYGAPWVANFNGSLIAALHVTVPRKPFLAPAAPLLQIYRLGATSPAFSQTVPVSVIRGSQALLYRLFAAGPANQGPIYCIDLTIPNGTGAGTAHLYYPDHGRMFEAVGNFTVQR